MKNFTLIAKIAVPTLALTLSACMPPKDREIQAGSITFSNLSEKQANCESKIRQNMETRAFQMRPVAGFDDEITKLNSIFSGTFETTFKAKQVRKEMTGIGVNHTARTQDHIGTILYELFRAAADTDASFTLDVSTTLLEKTSSVSVLQKYQVSEGCDLSLRSSEVEKLSKETSNEYKIVKKSVYLDREIDIKKESFSIPEDASLLNFQLFDKPEAIPRFGYYYTLGMGLTEMTSAGAETTTSTEFGKQLAFTNLTLEFRQKDRVLMSGLIGVDKNANVQFARVSNQTTWTLPKELWNTISLGASPNTNAFIKMELPKGYFQSRNSMRLLTSKLPVYDHFAAYWKISDVKKLESPSRFDALLTENATFTAEGKTSDLDLESNSTIETELPEIQKIANEIAAKSKTRTDQLQGILEYLSDHYKPDLEMIKKNVIRPLTTSEALNRGKGVCQHYSVIFTAIARALKIPTRIVLGYFLSDVPGAHAWVEAEIKPGIWQVIEPQDRNGLKAMQTRFYLPTGRATFIEDKSKKMSESISEQLAIDYILQPSGISKATTPQ